MIVTKVPMNEFCTRWSTRYPLSKPWRKGEYIYATDCRIAVRCSLECFDGEVEDPAAVPGKKFPKVDEVLSQFGMVEAWSDFPKLEDCAVCHNKGYFVGECENCAGLGHVFCNMEHEHDCDNCDGEGKAEIDCTKCRDKVKIGIRTFQMRIVRQCLLIPGVQWGVATSDPRHAIFLKFDGGIGAAMPLDPDRI